MGGRPLESYLISLSLNFSMYLMEVLIILPALEVCFKNNLLYVENNWSSTW